MRAFALFRFLFSGFALLTAMPLVHADVSVFTCEPEWAALAQEVGGEHVTTFSATTAYQDPHRIQARPSLIAKLRQADLLVCSGAGLEAGWLPLLLRQSANPEVQPGKRGYVEAAMEVERLGQQAKADRSMGDIHPQGNPHVHLDPRRLGQIATVISARLQSLDPDHAQAYRQQLNRFERRWSTATKRWQQQASPLKGKRAVVYHSGWEYLFDWLDIDTLGALEPKPGLPPSPGHLAQLKDRLVERPADFIVYSNYQDPAAAEWLAERSRTPMVELPFTVGGAEQADDLVSLFDAIIQRLLQAAGT